jgi:hypothetical protein
VLTAVFAADAILMVAYERTQTASKRSKGLMITADGGNSNVYRVRLEKLSFRPDEIRPPIMVCHLPPCTSKWIKPSIFSSRSSPSNGAASQ